MGLHRRPAVHPYVHTSTRKNSKRTHIRVSQRTLSGTVVGCETVRAMTRTTARATIPVPENGTVRPRQVPHAECRPREYLPPRNRPHRVPHRIPLPPTDQCLTTAVSDPQGSWPDMGEAGTTRVGRSPGSSIKLRW